jgi:hypothetical protein
MSGRQLFDRLCLGNHPEISSNKLTPSAGPAPSLNVDCAKLDRNKIASAVPGPAVCGRDPRSANGVREIDETRGVGVLCEGQL